MKTVSVVLSLPLEDYRRLVPIADSHQVQAHVLIERLVAAAVRPAPAALKGRPPLPARKVKRIRELAELGYSLKEIAGRVGVSPPTAAKYMQELPNPEGTK